MASAPEPTPWSRRVTPEQISLVQDSVDALAARGDDVVRAFYERLFERAPETRAMFPDDMAELRQNFLVTLTGIVGALGDFDGLAAQTRSLGARHRGYGVTARHYLAVREALVDTMAAELGDAFTDRHAEAWRKSYDLMAELMQQGAAPVGSGPRIGDRLL